MWHRCVISAAVFASFSFEVPNALHSFQAACSEDEKKNVVIVKYGGSAITNKSTFESLNLESLKITAQQVKNILGNNHTQAFVIVHGAGSFGHFQSNEFGLRHGGEMSSWRLGMALTRRSVLKLNAFVTDAHLSLDLPVLSLPLFPSCRTDNRKLVHPGPLLTIESILDKGLIPILHGDVVFDDSQKCSVFSGDRILLWACENFSTRNTPSRAVFLTDVAGVYDKSPATHPDARLIRTLYVQEDGSVEFPDTDSLAHDVTGGIRGKIQTAIEMAKLGVPVYVVQVGTEHAFAAMSGTEPAVGTKIVMKQSRV